MDSRRQAAQSYREQSIKLNSKHNYSDTLAPAKWNLIAGRSWRKLLAGPMLDGILVSRRGRGKIRRALLLLFQHVGVPAMTFPNQPKHK